MAIYLPSTAEEEQLALDELTPREIVAELDNGQLTIGFFERRGRDSRPRYGRDEVPSSWFR